MSETKGSTDRPLLASLTRSRWSGVCDRLRVLEAVLLIFGCIAVIALVGSPHETGVAAPHVGQAVIAGMCLLTASRIFRFCVESGGRTYLQRIRSGRLVLPIVWLIGVGLLLVRGLQAGSYDGLWAGEISWTEGMLFLTGLMSALNGFRIMAGRTHNSAILLVGSFLVVTCLGMVLLMLPACRADAGASAPWHVALFTATSASCVTGLIVEPTGSYWSPVGHAVIFSLFQVGGLGILTFSAFIAILSGRRGLQFREAKTIREVLDADTVADSRRLLATILLVTITIEVIGALLLMGLWPDRTIGSRIWYAAFHSVSAYCNAGFSLHDDGFLDMGMRWQVWGPLTLLIILGGLGFPVIRDLCGVVGRLLTFRNAPSLFNPPRVTAHLTLNSRVVLWSTGALLVCGAVSWFVLESLVTSTNSSSGERLADAWFQSVTFRTAGFNTVDHGSMSPATKLMAIFLMFIGAAPGSTGGGVKITVFAVTLLNIRAVFRGRDRVEVFGRSIPTPQVSRSLAMIGVGIMIVLGTTGLLVIFEQQPEKFLDHLYEATSAFGTVGVSAGITGDLTLPSRMLICLVMFLGRVGPITLLLAMASPAESTRYDYPEERVNLG